LAKEFDISDVGLSKACRKHSIPVPPVGHWTKVEHGKPVSQPPLPKGDDIEVVLEANRFRPPPPPESVAVLKPMGLEVHLPATTEHLAPLAGATFKRLSKSKPDARGIVSYRGPDVFHCEVSPKLVDRAVRILHAVETAVPEIGTRLCKAPEDNCIQIERDGIGVTFRLFEKFTSTFEILKDPKYSWNDRKIYTYTMTGRLTLQIEGYFDGQKSWADGKRDNLDDKLSMFVNGLVVAIESIRAKRLEWARQKAVWEEAARVREEMERQQREEEALRTQLLKEAGAWRDFELGTEYLKLLRSQLGDTTTLPTAAQEWLLRAERVLTKVDPSLTRIHQLRTPPDSPMDAPQSA
jgi:hypothetical protein